MANAPMEETVTIPGYEDVEAGIVKWPLSGRSEKAEFRINSSFECLEITVFRFNVKWLLM